MLLPTETRTYTLIILKQEYHYETGSPESSYSGDCLFQLPERKHSYFPRVRTIMRSQSQRGIRRQKKVITA